MKLQKLLSVVLVTSMLAGCNPPPPGAGQDTGGVSKQDLGMGLGAIGGGIIGSTMGGGNGRIATTIAGALLGGFAGSSIGRSLDSADAAAANRAAQQALENNQPGQSMPWKNNESGHYGSITPQAPYQTADGTYCREYQQNIVVGGKTQNAYGRACRQPDGSWKIIQ